MIQRDGVTIDLEHDAGDRLTSVENTITGQTIEYVYDGQGNRVGAIEGSEVRQFLVAPGMGSGLNSTDLIADGNGNLISNYVYAGGASPFMMLDANGNPVYYLSDGMGSVIGLANGAGMEVGDFRYDSFGNVREEWGGAISSTGGDFRFQGQWLEEDTGIYHFRARDYDAQTGTFLSRDPVDPTQQQPESFNPYQFAYNNPYVYSDPTGMFTITELNAAQNLQTQLSNARTFAGNQAKEYLKEKIGDAFSEIVASVFNYFVPGTSAVGQLLGSVSRGESLPNDLLENMIIGTACAYFEGIPLLDNLRLYPRVQSDGTPSGGISCAQRNESRDPRIQRNLDSLPGSRPEFIFINGNYVRNNPDSFLIGDIKLTQRAAYRDVTTNDNQWRAMANYAREWQMLPFVSYLSLLEDVPGSADARGISKSDRQQMAREALERNVILVLGNLID